MNKPWDRTYWVEPGVFLAGCYPGDLNPGVTRMRVDGLAAAGIRHVINLMEEDETDYQGKPFAPYRQMLPPETVMVRHPIRDLSVPEAALVETILAEIDENIGAGRPVMVHCWGGIGRTGVSVGCWLARHGWPGAAALKRLAELRRGEPTGYRSSPETTEQRAFVLAFK